MAERKYESMRKHHDEALTRVRELSKELSRRPKLVEPETHYQAFFEATFVEKEALRISAKDVKIAFRVWRRHDGAPDIREIPMLDYLRKKFPLSTDREFNGFAFRGDTDKIEESNSLC